MSIDDLEDQVDKLIKEQGYLETVALINRLKEYLTTMEDQLRPETKFYLNRLTGDQRRFL